MAGLPNNRTPKVGPWPKGINNLAPEGELPRDDFGTKPVALREADNVDVTTSGSPRRRRGYEAVLQATLSHSGWSAPGLGYGFFVDNGALKVFRPGTAPEDLGVQVGNAPLSYALVDGRVLFSNAIACGMIDQWLRVHPWACPAPAGAPTLTTTTGYAMHPGVYQVAVAFVDEHGRESPLSQTTAINVPEGHAISVQLDEPPPEFGFAVIYTTEANDQVLRRGAQFVSGAGAYLVTTPANGIANTDRVLAVLPPGQITRYGGGRHWVAAGRTLMWSAPLRPGVFDPETNYAVFESDITMVEPVGAGEPGAGVYVGTKNNTFWLHGADPAEFRRVHAYPAGVVPGTPLTLPAKALGLEQAGSALMWLARDGQHCVGLAGGNVNPIHASQATTEVGQSGAAVFIERNGFKQVVTSMKNARATGMAASDKAVAHVIHDES